MSGVLQWGFEILAKARQASSRRNPPINSSLASPRPRKFMCVTGIFVGKGAALSISNSMKDSCFTRPPLLFYPLFASLDVGAQMMKGRSGEVLWDDTIRLGIELRKKLRAIRREFDQKEKDLPTLVF